MWICGECGQKYDEAPAGELCPVDNYPVRQSDDPLLGQTIGSYRVAKLLGAGGMGRVYKGVHPAIGSRVAIKLLTGELANDRELVDRFFSEARAVNLIRHEGIVNIVDLAYLADGRPYIVMGYLDGQPLARLLNEAPVPLGDLCTYAIQILGALGAAHGKGIIHRDLKPDTVVVSPSGRVKVLDFGIAKLTGDSGAISGKPGPTRTGSLLGTPYYMSPEQCLGKPIDGRADLYALGVILYEALTGRVPFKAEVLFELLRLQISEQPVPPRHLRPDVPESIERVVMRALEKDPGARYADAAAMAQALDEVALTLPADAYTARVSGGFAALSPRLSMGRTPPPSPTPGPWVVTGTPAPLTMRKRRGLAWAALGAGVLAVAAVIAVAVRLARHQGEDKMLAAGSGSEPLPSESALPSPLVSPPPSLSPSPSPSLDPSASPVASLPPAASPRPGSGMIAPPALSGSASGAGATPRHPKGALNAATPPKPTPDAAVPSPSPSASPAVATGQPPLVWTADMGEAIKLYSDAIQKEQYDVAEKALTRIPDSFENKKELVRAIRLAKFGAIETHKRMLDQRLREGRCDMLEDDITFFKKYSPDDVAAAEKVLTECQNLDPSDLKERRNKALEKLLEDAQFWVASGNGRFMLQELAKARKLAPSDPRVIKLMVQAHCFEGDADDARKWLAKLPAAMQDETKEFCKKKAQLEL